MRKEKDNFKKEKKLLKNPLINKFEISKAMEIKSQGLFYDKLSERNGARFTEPQKKAIIKILKKLSKQLSNGLYPKKKLQVPSGV